jgi:hypothetical protein
MQSFLGIENSAQPFDTLLIDGENGSWRENLDNAKQQKPLSSILSSEISDYLYLFTHTWI